MCCRNNRGQVTGPSDCGRSQPRMDCELGPTDRGCWRRCGCRCHRASWKVRRAPPPASAATPTRITLLPASRGSADPGPWRGVRSSAQPRRSRSASVGSAPQSAAIGSLNCKLSSRCSSSLRESSSCIMASFESNSGTALHVGSFVHQSRLTSLTKRLLGSS